MQTTLDRSAHRMTSANRHAKNNPTVDIAIDVGFPFSAWFFLTTVALTFLDAYFLGGRGIGSYLNVPTDILVNARSLVNI